MITRTFASSSSNAVYTAQVDPDSGKSSCNCPGWRFMRHGVRGCSHTRILTADAAPAAATAPTAPTPAPSAIPPKPMLASAMIAGRTLGEFCTDAYRLEEKFDGERKLVRVAAGTVRAWSRPRSGKVALVADLPAHLTAAAAMLPDGLYDGELVVPGGRSWDVTRLTNRSALRLVVFDVLELMGTATTAMPYTERRGYLAIAVEHYTRQDARGFIVIPDMLPVSGAAVQAIWDRGGEGAIVKRAASTYQPGKRSPDWIKVKKVAQDVLTITGFKAGKLGPFAVTELRHADGRETTVSTLNNAVMTDVAKDPARYIGRRLVIQYTELTDTRGYRHGGWDHLAGDGE